MLHSFILQGVVTVAQNALDHEAWLISAIKYDEIVRQELPLFRGRDNALEMQAYNHPYDTKQDGLIAWLATAVPVLDADLLEPSPGAAPSVYIVAGTLLSGIDVLTSTATNALGGYAGLYAELVSDYDSVTEASNWLLRPRWRR